LSTTEAAGHNNGTTVRSKRVVFTMGGKGGVGKTGCMVAIAEWMQDHGGLSPAGCASSGDGCVATPLQTIR
jgi:hypothetical protein